MSDLASAAAQEALLQSSDPQLAANKRLVYDMYRAIVQGGHAEMAPQFFTEGYIQHNPNVASGRDALVAYISGSRPARPIEPKLNFDLISIFAERDMVCVVSVRRELDDAGEAYKTSWFDCYRIEDGLIAEHWDPAPKIAAMARFDPNVTTSFRETK